MTTKKKPTRGGKRPGAGRPAVGDEPSVVVTFRATPGQKAKLETLGGAPWIRARIDKAKVKP
jgi:hypothetical protein